MKIGINLEFTRESGEIAALGRLIEATGYDSLFLPEHIVIPYQYTSNYRWGNDGQLPEHYGRWIDPYIGLATIAAVTSRIQLGTGISLLPERDPIVTAKMIATLDLFSNGRTLFAFGAGWLKEEMEIMGTPFQSRWKRLRESVEAMKILWTQREASLDGDIIKFPPVRCEPKPAQPGGPPVLLGVHNPKYAIPRVVRYCDGWYPLIDSVEDFPGAVLELRRQAEDAGRDPAQLRIVPLVTLQNDALQPGLMDSFKNLGIEHFVIRSDDHGLRATTGRGHEFVEAAAPLVEQAHSLG